MRFGRLGKGPNFQGGYSEPGDVSGAPLRGTGEQGNLLIKRKL